MKVFVVGGNGFLGRQLVASLISKEVNTVVVDKNLSGLKNSCEGLKVDICDYKSLSKMILKPSDAVVHLAARQYHGYVPKQKRINYFLECNFHGTLNLLNYCKNSGCSNFIFFSTDMVYGSPKKTPVVENSTLVPLGPYGFSKFYSEELCRRYRRKGMNITIFRPRLISGPGRLGVFQKLFFLIKNNLPVPLIGDGENHYQMVSVYDCVEAIFKAIEKGYPNEEFNLGSKNPPRVIELIGKLISDTGSKSFIVPINTKYIKKIISTISIFGPEILYPEQYQIADLDCVLNIDKSYNLLGWQPVYNDQDMILDAYDYFVNSI